MESVLDCLGDGSYQVVVNTLSFVFFSIIAFLLLVMMIQQYKIFKYRRDITEIKSLPEYKHYKELKERGKFMQKERSNSVTDDQANLASIKRAKRLSKSI